MLTRHPAWSSTTTKVKQNITDIVSAITADVQFGQIFYNLITQFENYV